MFAGLSDLQIISLFFGMASFFFILIGFLIKIVYYLFTQKIEDTIKGQSSLIDQKIDLTHRLVMSSIQDIKEDGLQVRQIAIEAHHAVDSHVLNYHRQG